MKLKILLLPSALALIITLFTSLVYAASDPLGVHNNKFGIHIISPIEEEVKSAANLVNSSGGDWGYVAVVIRSDDMDKAKWQQFFDLLSRYHLIPLVRLATKPAGNYWQKPSLDDSKKWADFLDNLKWPTQNRYVIVYNEPNHGQEWGNSVDPTGYAQILDTTIDVLKAKSVDFFVLNAGFDASAPHNPPYFFDEKLFLDEMEKAKPGILAKLDGWVSHSYPNPGFRGLPLDRGRGSITTFKWEQKLLFEMGVKKKLPVFITETGWVHAEGVRYDKSLPNSETIGQYLKKAYETVWIDPQIVVVAPFLLDYQDELFAHFSFKKLNYGQVLAAETDAYYPQYKIMAQIPKIAGLPIIPTPSPSPTPLSPQNMTVTPSSFISEIKQLVNKWLQMLLN
ncbi:hypothetical protein HY404_00400 [Candidatus Microgenomates bacterium]|nr:hypothetical protein [Candidatus Microgenomates bacterium]